MPTRSPLLLALATALLVGCAGGDAGGPDDRSPPESDSREDSKRLGEDGPAEAVAVDHQLLAKISAAVRLQAEDPTILKSGHEYDYIPALAYADLAAAREQLGLSQDAGFPGPRGRRLMASFAARPLFRFAPQFWSKWSMGSLGEVFDTGKIDAAAGTNYAFSGPLADEIGPEDAVVLRTRQPFGEIAERLQEMGYEASPEGRLLLGYVPRSEDYVYTSGTYEGVPFPAVGDARAGVVVLGGSRRVTRVVMNDDKDELTAVAEFVAELPGVGRVARSFGPRSCIVALGFGEGASPRVGELRAKVDGAVNAQRLLFGTDVRQQVAIDGEITFDDAVATDGYASARFVTTDKRNATRFAVEEVNRTYNCR